MLKNQNFADLSPQKDEQVQTRGRLYSDAPVTSDEFQEIPIIDMAIYLNQRDDSETSLNENVRLEC
jgi:hypothetical protein